MKTLTVLAGASAALLSLAGTSQAQVDFTVVPGLGGPRDLDFLGTHLLLSDGTEAYVWTAGTGAVSRGPAYNPTGISAGGAFLSGEQVLAGQYTAHRWDAQQGWASLGGLGGGGCDAFYSSAVDISAFGDFVAGNAFEQCFSRAYRWDAQNGMVVLPQLSPPDENAKALGVSYDGRYVVGWDSWARVPALWDVSDPSAPTIQHLDDAGEATAVSADGSIVVGGKYADAMLWRPGQAPLALPHVPGGLEARALAVDASGQTVVGRDGTSGPWGFPMAMLYRADLGSVDLNTFLPELGVELPPFAPLGSASAISGDGRVIAGGILGPFGPFEADAYVLTLPDAMLRATVDDVSLATGGTQPLTLNAGVERAGDLYAVLGSLSGTAPGFPTAGGALPLVLDAYTQLLLSSPGKIVAGGIGVLDGQGAATATVKVPAGAPAALAGETAHHAYVVIDAGTFAITEVSNARGLDFLP